MLKYILSMLLVIFFSTSLYADVRIVGYEYWFDDDYAGKSSVSLATPVETLSLQRSVSTTGLSDGLHNFNIRFEDSDGNWSALKSQPFYKVPQYAGDNCVGEYEYWFDDDYANKQIVAFECGNSTLELARSIDCSAIDEGLHRFNIRFKDAYGNRGVLNSQMFYKVPQYAGANGIIRYEYWFDDDWENRNIEIAGGDNPEGDLPDADASGGSVYPLAREIDYYSLTPGMHRFNIRFEDFEGNWSVLKSQLFYNSPQYSGDNQIDKYEYWFDDDYANKVEADVSPTTDMFSLQRAVAAASLENGYHIFNLRALDDYGNWSSLKSMQFYKVPQYVGSNVIEGYEYWFDDDEENKTQVDIASPSATVSVSRTIATEGLDAGNHYFNVRIWDSEGNYSVVYSFQFEKLTYHTITLNVGWNMISSYVEPSDAAISAVFSELSSSQLYLALNNTNQIYFHADGSGNLTTWDKTQGYRAYMFSGGQMTVSGTKQVPENALVPMNTGWNMIGYLRDAAIAPATAFASLSSAQLYLVLNNTNQIYFHADGSGNLTSLIPGQGYRAYMFSGANFYYPANGGDGKEAAFGARYKEPVRLKCEIEPTGNSAVLILATDAAFEGAEIGVWTSGDVLIGSAVAQNGKALLPLWGDDAQTETVEAALEGEPLILRYFDRESGELEEISAAGVRDMEYGENLSGIFYRKDAVLTAKASAWRDDNPLVCSPNPVKSKATIQFGDDASDAKLRVFNEVGSIVAECDARAGYAIFDATNLPSGVYYCVLKADGVSKMIKIAVVK